MQVRRIDPQGVKNPHVTLQSVLCYLWFYIQERIQLTLDHIECIYRKKNLYISEPTQFKLCCSRVICTYYSGGVWNQCHPHLPLEETCSLLRWNQKR